MLKEKIAAGKIHICQNLACRKVFSEPIKVEKLKAPKKEPYLACPFCLTEINTEEKTEATLNENIIEKPENCPHFMGFLSEKPHEEGFPEECLTCKVIVRCMFAAPKNSN
ncbi:MAG: hypothetical protein NWF01_02710 [Candidatus Bathyarchaeota archaeon]|nr:hypothetical protein [Candidatus Bathyarchaeota archaeon]